MATHRLRASHVRSATHPLSPRRRATRARPGRPTLTPHRPHHAINVRWGASRATLRRRARNAFRARPTSTKIRRRHARTARPASSRRKLRRRACRAPRGRSMEIPTRPRNARSAHSGPTIRRRPPSAHCARRVPTTMTTIRARFASNAAKARTRSVSLLRAVGALLGVPTSTSTRAHRVLLAPTGHMLLLGRPRASRV